MRTCKDACEGRNAATPLCSSYQAPNLSENSVYASKRGPDAASWKYSSTEEMMEGAPGSGEKDPALIMEPNLALPIQDVPQELEADFGRMRNEDQDGAIDAVSIKTTTDQIFNPPTEPQIDLEERKLGLSIVRNLGWSGSNYDDYEYV